MSHVARERGHDGSNGPHFNNDKSPRFDATTDTAVLEDPTVRYHRQGSISWLLSYRRCSPCPLPGPYGTTQDRAPLTATWILSSRTRYFLLLSGSFFLLVCHGLNSRGFFFHHTQNTTITSFIRPDDSRRTILMTIWYQRYTYLYLR